MFIGGAGAPPTRSMGKATSSFDVPAALLSNSHVLPLEAAAAIPPTGGVSSLIHGEMRSS